MEYLGCLTLCRLNVPRSPNNMPIKFHTTESSPQTSLKALGPEPSGCSWTVLGTQINVFIMLVVEHGPLRNVPESHLADRKEFELSFRKWPFSGVFNMPTALCHDHKLFMDLQTNGWPMTRYLQRGSHPQRTYRTRPNCDHEQRSEPICC